MADIKSERLQLDALENLFKQKRFSEALNFSKKLTRDYPHSFPIKFIHVRTLKELNRLGEAVEALAEMMQTFPNNINLLAEGGMLAVKRTKFDEALDYYNRILFLDPFNSEAKESIDRIHTIKKSSAVNSGVLGKKMDFVSYQSEQFNRSDTLQEFDVTEVQKAASAEKTATMEEVIDSNITEPEMEMPEPMDALDFSGDSEVEPSLPPPIHFEELGMETDLTELPSIPESHPESLPGWDTQEELDLESEEPVPTDTPEALDFAGMIEPEMPEPEIPEIASSHVPQALDFVGFEDTETENPDAVPDFDPTLGWNVEEELSTIDSDEQSIPEEIELQYTDETEEPEPSSMPDDSLNLNEPEETETFSSSPLKPPPVIDFGDFSDVGVFPYDRESEELPDTAVEEEFALGWQQENLPDELETESAPEPAMSDDEEFTVSSFFPTAPDVAEPKAILPEEPFMAEFPETVQEEIKEEIQTEVEEEVQEELSEEFVEGFHEGFHDAAVEAKTHMVDEFDTSEDDENSDVEEEIEEVIEEEAQIITESAAELYQKQGLLEDAAMIYAKLYDARKEERFLVKINQLRGIRTNQRKIDVLTEFLKVIQAYR